MCYSRAKVIFKKLLYHISAERASFCATRTNHCPEASSAERRRGLREHRPARHQSPNFVLLSWLSIEVPFLEIVDLVWRHFGHKLRMNVSFDMGTH